MNRNQANHLMQWLIYIIFAIIVLIFIPVESAWIFLLAVGAAFIVAYILRLVKKYPGKEEPLYIDLLSGIISIFMIIPYQFITGTRIIFFLKIITPVIILIPHFVYIIKNSGIHPPGITLLILKIRKKCRSKTRLRQ